MERQDIEKKINERLAEIQQLIKDYLPSQCILSMAVCNDRYWAYSLKHDENDEAIIGEYLLQVDHAEEEECA